MHWIRAHALPITFAAAALLAITVSIIWKQGGTGPVPITTWSGTEVAILGFSARGAAAGETKTDGAPDLMQNVVGSAPFSYALPFSGALSGNTGAIPEAPASSSAHQQTVQNKNMSAPVSNSGSLFDPYSFVPRGLISIKTSPQSTARDAGQQALFEYGNRVGLEIKEFESAHADVVQTLKDFFDDRTNQSKAARVIAAGNDYEALGERLLGMDSIPADVTTLHAALAQSYKAVGEGLANLTKAADDTGAVNAIAAYDASAGEFIKNYTALAEFFSARGVTFSSTDPGAMFTFSPATL